MPLVLSAMAMVGVLCIFLSLALPRRGGQVQMQDRLSQFAVREVAPQSLDEIELERPFTERVLGPLIISIGERMVNRTPQKELEKIRRNIVLAGSPRGLTAESFLTIKIVLMIVLAGFAFLIGTSTGQLLYTIAGVVLFGIIGYLMPGIWLDQKIRSRKSSIQKRLPDAIDLMTICMQAGASLDMAMQRVVSKDKGGNPIALEFNTVLRQIQLGRPRSVALRDMSSRCQVPDVDSYIASIVQADALGLPLVHVMEIQSEQMRIRRRQRAEALAAQAPIKMLFPMIFLIFPSMFVVILGPAIPTIAAGFSNINH